MCVVSNVGDDWSRREKWPTWPASIPFPPFNPELPQKETTLPWPISTIPENNPAFRLGQLEKQMKELREQVDQMHEELRKAKQQDIDEGNPDCEMEDKVAVLKKIAEIVGVDLGDVFPNG